MINTFKKIGLSFALAGTFGASANAACDFAFCIGDDVGVGISYSDFGGNGTADGNLTSGYGALDLDLLFARRLKLRLGFKVGVGTMNLSSSSLSSLPSSATGVFGNIDLKLGFNIASLESPLYINFMMFTGNSATNNDFVQGVGIIGIELECKSHISDKTSLLYSFGGSVVNGVYGNKLDFDNTMSDKLGYGLLGSLGLERSITSLWDSMLRVWQNSTT